MRHGSFFSTCAMHLRFFLQKHAHWNIKVVEQCLKIDDERATSCITDDDTGQGIKPFVSYEVIVVEEGILLSRRLTKCFLLLSRPLISVQMKFH